MPNQCPVIAAAGFGLATSAIALAVTTGAVAAALAGAATAVVTLMLARRCTPPAADPWAPVHGRLDLARRRGEGLAVGVVLVGDDATARTLPRVLRRTDCTVIAGSGPRSELHAWIYGVDFDRAALERRVVAESGVALRFGWAGFPGDGLTLEALTAVARARVAPHPRRPEDAGHPAAPDGAA